MDAESTEQFITGDTNRFAMLLFLLSETAFFAFLIIAYVYFHGSVEAGPNAANSLHPLKTGMYTIFLLASSLTARSAEKQYDLGRKGAFLKWMAITLLLGAIFLFGQALEYIHLYRDDVTVSRDIFGAAFFTLTGFHGLHVLLGLIGLGVLSGVVVVEKRQGEQSSAIRTITVYWHFVDWVWVVIFSVVYLWGLF